MKKTILSTSRRTLYQYRTYSTPAPSVKVNELNNYMQSGMTYFKYFQWERAMDNFSRVIETSQGHQRENNVELLEPVREKLILAYRYRGKLFHLKQDYKKAVEDLSAAIRLEPLPILENSHQKKTTEPQPQLNEVIEDCFVVRGDSYYNMNKYSEAIQDYSRALESLKSIYQKELKSSNNTKSSIIVQEESIIEQNATNNALKNNPCVQQEEEHDMKTGMSYSSQQALRQLIEVYLKRGSAYQYSYHAEKALNDFSKVIELCPQDIRGYYMRATLLDQMERYRDAVKDYNHVIRLDPKHHIARNRLQAIEVKC